MKFVHINQIFLSNGDFWNSMDIFCEQIIYNWCDGKNGIANETLDGLDYNVDTALAFEELGADYDKWAHWDENSYIEKTITMSKYELIKNCSMEIIGKTNIETPIYLDFDGEPHMVGGKKEKVDLYRIA